jgi:trk system potassium uptake protein TrkA
MKKQYAVIGLGRFGYWVAKTLINFDCEVLAIDNDEEKVKDVSDFVTHAVVLDAADEKALKSVDLQDIDVAIVSIGENIEDSILAVMILKECNVKYIVAKAVTPLHGKVLENLKVNKVVYPERDVAIRIAKNLINPNIVEQLELSPEYSIIEMPAPKPLIGKSLKESQLRNKYGINLIAIKRNDSENDTEKKKMNIIPFSTEIIYKDDLLVLVGSNKDLEKLEHLE